MAMTVHGPGVDVLVGGDDLTFPHHAYQAAMVEAASGVGPFARARMHVGTVRLNGERMAKSTGNLVLVDDVLTRCSPAALRLLLIDRHYGDSWDFDQDGIDAASARLERIYTAAATQATDTSPDQELHDQLMRALTEDLDVPAALTIAEAAGGSVARQLIKVLRLG